MIIHIDYIYVLYVLCDIYIHSFQHSGMLCCGVQVVVDYSWSEDLLALFFVVYILFLKEFTFSV